MKKKITISTRAIHPADFATTAQGKMKYQFYIKN